MNRMCEFFVEGEPVAMPKKQIAVRGKFPVVYERDGKGRARAWRERILLAIRDKYPNITPIKKPSGVEVMLTFYRTRPKSNKNEFPVTKPDLDNLSYLIHNLLEGIFYEDDSQIIRHFEWKYWTINKADNYEAHNAGVDIEITEIKETK